MSFKTAILTPPISIASTAPRLPKSLGNKIERTVRLEVAIVGLGYVGLPLCLQFAQSGVNVLGLDVDSDKVDALNQGRSYIKHIPAETVANQVMARRIVATTDFALVKAGQAGIICVATPLSKTR